MPSLNGGSHGALTRLSRAVRVVHGVVAIGFLIGLLLHTGGS